MTANELRKKYLDFFESKGHTIIPSASLVPRETDGSTLFTTAGMHPLVPYLLGEQHPGGNRVANVQKCVRTGDIDDVGDNRHLTFFEMMGNWSFGDYFKKEAIVWSFEFLTDPKWLGLDKNRLYVTVFKGENVIPRDEEAIATWQKVFADAGMEVEVAGEDEMIKSNVRIIPLGTDDNFWIAGATGPCGGDTEMFYDMRPEEGKLEGKFGDLVDSFRIMEVWNNVFMEFNKTAEGKYEKLAKPNVDTGMGVERTLTVLDGEYTVFETELFKPLFEKIAEISGSGYQDSDETKKAFRIIADHVRASVFMIADGVTPLNTGAGYVLRRLIRRAVRYGKLLGIEKDFTVSLAEIVIQNFGDFYPELKKQREIIFAELKKEEEKFRKTLENGLKQFNKLSSTAISGKDAFDLYQTYGFPLELTIEIAKEKGVIVDEKEAGDEMKKHQDLSRTASAGMFKGGLADSGEETARLHTAAHLLLASLRQILGDHVFQKGSNITPERLRLDFSHPEKVVPEQLILIENLVNRAIEAKLDVLNEEMTLEQAKKLNAMGVFESKYGEKVTVYSIINDAGEVVSREICGGPHAKNTGELGHFKIQKEEASSSGVRRIKAVLT
ncbi:MAG: Alanine-tRNA ligase [Candidatus Moranbacteria bacterium GW2011_GWC2_37_73]|nr:MAG: alanyl-tRNA synthetase, alanyl-tRNA synthetase [Parcubacteria group bacterium GW2011_GWC1_36_108]KKQ00189.1 MAG: Alanine-tRNA ligase [Candidatus Moranbacteria bacterium GW2011_GWD1_36_198]KKQ39760.1 MAG: Alanine-tRNA ligase [Candidatus Moranbacteria bacterium GW2011_GWC2_37_73]HAR99783.1 alanine--tRNA ligase [Candidatus Moranbacteria bacterium]HBI50831.1 alanine--tRNA ligase [Candidatus Moranbacteria bacterium]